MNIAEEGTPRLTARGAQTRARIVGAAADLMLLGGVAETSLDAVLAATGTSKSQLYHYFADKDDLVLAVIKWQTERVLQSQQPQLFDVDSVAGLRRWRDKLVESQRMYGCQTACPVGSLAAELAGSETARAVLVDSFAQWESYLAAGFTAMRERGELDPSADPGNLATTMMTAVQGGFLLSKTTRSTRPLELALDMAIGHIETLLR